MSLVIGILGAILLGMDKLKVKTSIKTALSLAILINALAAAVVILSYANVTLDESVIKSMLALIIMVCGAMLIISASLLMLKNVNNAIPSALALTAIMLAMVPLIIALGLVAAVLSLDVLGAGWKAAMIILAGVIVSMLAVVGV